MPDKLPEIRVTPIPRLAQGGRWRVEAMRSYSSDLLLWFTRGQGRITVAGITRGYGPHNAVFIPAGTMHGFEVSKQVFGSAVFLPGTAALPLPETPVHLRIRAAAPQSEVTGILDNLTRELDGARPERIRAIHHHAGLLSVWLRRQMVQGDSLRAASGRPPNRAGQLTARYSDLIEQNYHTGKTVAQYAAELGVSATHLSRVCNQTCGRPALALLNDRLIYEARRLLRDTSAPVREVAQKLGFTSAAYFSRAFQRQTGQTPSAFRRAT